MTARKLKGFEKGDIVTRDGTDRQKVLDVNDAGDLITVECIKRSQFDWCEVGDVEDNLARRYDYADDAIEIGRAATLSIDGKVIGRDVVISIGPPR